MGRDVRRILDANGNRAREAARVMEEAARFLIDDQSLASACKIFRHDLSLALKATGPLSTFRDTKGDVGTKITTATERVRRNAAEVVSAAAKRLAEALRSCEEYGKLVDARIGSRFEKLRYRAYTLEAKLLMLLPQAPQWRLCVILTETMCQHPWLDVAAAALDGGADCLQLREKNISDRMIIRRVRQLLRLSDGRASIILNDRVDLAAASEADGVHLGQGDLPLSAARQIMPGRIIGQSTHSQTEAFRAAAGGADYCGVGAIHATTTKKRKPSGLKYLKQFVKTHPTMPHLAIGGITPDNVGSVVAEGARGIAVSAVVCGDRKPATVVRKLIRQIPRPV